MSDYLPQEVLEDIFSRLSIKTLGICLCVCQSWHSVITRDTFITDHFNKTNNKRLFLLRYLSHDPTQDLCSLHYDNESFDKCQDFCSPAQSLNGYYQIVNSCNGVICLLGDIKMAAYKLILWNPTIQKFVSLPHPLIFFSFQRFSTYAFGFGFDSLSNDYKVVMFSPPKEKQDCDSSSHPKVNVYSLSTNSWRDISTKAHSYNMVRFQWTQVFMSGSVHWIAYRHNSGIYNLILRFNVSSELFDEMRLPESLVTSRTWTWALSIAVLGGYVSVVNLNPYEIPGSCSIWIMREYNAAGSWKKQFEIDLVQELNGKRVRLVKVLGLMGNGKILLEMYDGWLFTYEPENQQVKDLGIHGLEGSFHLDNHVASLFLLSQGKEDLQKENAKLKKRKRTKIRFSAKLLQRKKKGLILPRNSHWFLHGMKRQRKS